MGKKLLKEISQFPNPAERILEWVQVVKPRVTIDELRSALSKMSRSDCVRIVDKFLSKGLMLRHIDPAMNAELCKELDQGGYKDLGIYYGLDKKALSKISQHSNPSERVLDWVQVANPEESLLALSNAFKETGQDDCSQIIVKHFLRVEKSRKDLWLKVIDSPYPIKKDIDQIELKLAHDASWTSAPDDDIYNEAYRLALKDGKTINTRIPIMIVGQDRSGKTSLRRHLQGQQHNACEPSTCGIEVNLVELTESNAEEPWISKDVSKYTLTKHDVDMHINKEAADYVTKQKSVPKSSKVNTAKFEEPVTETQPGPNNRAGTDDNVSSLQTDERPQLKEPVALPSSETKAKIKSMVESPDDKPSIIMALLHDLAGQRVFYETHHLFLKPRCPYIVVYDLERPFDETAEQRFKPTCTDEDIEIKNPLLATNLDIFLAWFNVLNKLGEILGQTSEASLPSFQIPPVLVALTKSDRFKGDLNKQKKRIKDILKKKGFKNVFVEPYIIDNTSSGKENEDDVRKLRKKARELMKEMLEKQRPVPISWEQFEAKLTEKMVNEQVPYILLEDALALGECCGVENVKAAINFLHHQGVVLHNVGSPVVVLNPVWLMNIFAEIITVPQEDIPIDASHRALLEEGILMEEYLTKREHGEVVKKLLLEFGLICPWHHKEGPAFVVPSLTPVMEKGDEVVEMLAESPIAPLYLHFRQGHMLPGFFTRLLGLVINKNSIFLCLQPRLYCNYAMLSFDYHEIEFDVYLVEQLAGIKIGVVRTDGKDEEFIQFVKYLKQSIIECTNNLKDNEGLYRDIDVDLLVKCTVCFGKQTTCLLHRKTSCDHDSCAHFWTLHELQQYTKDPVCPSSDVRRKSFPLTPVLPWLNLEMTVDQSYSMELQRDAKGSVGQEKSKLGFAGKCNIEIGSEHSNHAESNAHVTPGRLTEDMITRLSRKIGKDWDSLGGLMEIPYEEREMIKRDLANYPDIPSKACKVLAIFNESNTFSLKLLVKFLKEIGRSDVAQDVPDQVEEEDVQTGNNDQELDHVLDNTELSPREMSRLSGRITNWDVLAGFLDIPSNITEDLRRNVAMYPDLRSRTEKVLDIFNKRGDFCRAKLAECLIEMQRQDVLSDVRDGSLRKNLVNVTTI